MFVARSVAPSDPTRYLVSTFAGLHSSNLALRHRYCFYRVLEPDRWIEDVEGLLTEAAAIVVDTSVFRTNIAEELRLISQRHTLMTKLILIHEDHLSNDPAEDRVRYCTEVPAASRVLEGSISYSLASPKSLDNLWNIIVRQCAAILSIPLSSVPHYPAPNRPFIRAKVIVAVLNNQRLSKHVGVGRSDVTFKDADQGDWDAARQDMTAVGGALLDFLGPAIEPPRPSDVGLPLAPTRGETYAQKAEIGGIQFSTRADSGDAGSLSKGMQRASGRGWGLRRDRGCRVDNSGTRESWGDESRPFVRRRLVQVISLTPLGKPQLLNWARPASVAPDQAISKSSGTSPKDFRTSSPNGSRLGPRRTKATAPTFASLFDIA
jgi:hypothetical protein